MFEVIVFLLLFACSNQEPTLSVEQPTSSEQHQVAQHKPGPEQKQKGMPGLSSKEDLTSSWKTDFAVDVPITVQISDCPDADNDGYFDAKKCSKNPAMLDCNDTDASIGPLQEIYIPAGPFIMGSQSNHAGSDEDPVHVVQLSGYCLDKREVSTEEFANWLKNKKRTPQGTDIKHINQDASFEINRSNFPVEGVTWKEANDYCSSLAKTLPTEAQWEKAGRGGCEKGSDTSKCDPSDLRAYPWGNEKPTCDRANHQLSNSQMPKLCASDTVLPDALPLGNGPYGHQHLAGNVWEFVLDVWHPSVYQEGRIDPIGPNSGDMHVLRGGGWNTFSTNMRVANRFHDLVMGTAAGFRCARSFTKGNSDNVVPLSLQAISGTIQSEQALQGRALYVTAFDSNDADDSGMLAPGRSPISELRLTPNGKKQQTFSIKVPQGGSYILSAALDAGTGGKKDNYISASGSGGFGQAEENPISVTKERSGIVIRIQRPPNNPQLMKHNKPPGKPPQGHPPRKKQ
jgi:formylglycine-generating enzyme